MKMKLSMFLCRWVCGLLLPLCGLWSCMEDEGIGVSMSDQQIQFTAETDLSRALLDANDLATSGTKMDIYGFLNGSPLTNGTTPLGDGCSLAYINGNWVVVDNNNFPLFIIGLKVGTINSTVG